MRHSEYVLAAIGVVLFGVFVFRNLPERQPAPDPAPQQTPTRVNTASFQPDVERLLEVFSEQAPQASRITGQVVDETGAPIANARLRVNINGRNSTRFRSDANGAFSIEPTRRPRALTFEVSAEGFLSTPEEPAGGIWDAERNGTEGIQLVLARAARASGVVVNGSGVPLQRLPMYLRPSDNPASDWIVDTTSGTDGVFMFPALPPGNYSFGFYEHAPGGRIWKDAAPTGDQRIQVAKGTVLTELRVVAPIDFSDQIVSGVVTDANGEPLRRALISDRDRNRIAITDENGRFFGRVMVFPNSLTASFDDHAAQTHELDAGREDLRFTLTFSPPAVLSGRVIYASSGMPVPKFTINRREFEQSDGQFDGVRVSAGRETISIQVRGYPDTTFRFAPVVSGERRNVEVLVHAGTQFEGRVLDSDGRSVRLARVEIVDPRKHGVPGVGGTDTTSDDGSFLLGPVHDGTVEINVRTPEQIEETFSVNVSPSMPIAELRLARRYSLRIDIPDESIRAVSLHGEEPAVKPAIGVILFRGPEAPQRVSSANLGIDSSVVGLSVVRNGIVEFRDSLESGTYTAVIAAGDFVNGRSFSGAELKREVVEIPENAPRVTSVRVNL